MSNKQVSIVSFMSVFKRSAADADGWVKVSPMVASIVLDVAGRYPKVFEVVVGSESTRLKITEYGEAFAEGLKEGIAYASK